MWVLNVMDYRSNSYVLDVKMCSLSCDLCQFLTVQPNFTPTEQEIKYLGILFFVFVENRRGGKNDESYSGFCDLFYDAVNNVRFYSLDIQGACSEMNCEKSERKSLSPELRYCPDPCIVILRKTAKPAVMTTRTWCSPPPPPVVSPPLQRSVTQDIYAICWDCTMPTKFQSCCYQLYGCPVTLARSLHRTQFKVHTNVAQTARPKVAAA